MKGPITFNGSPVDPHGMGSFMSEWSLRQAEANHVETIEEANDFNIEEDDEDILHPALTVYEMHEVAEDNIALLEREKAEEAAYLAAQSNERDDEAQEETTNLHAQSALVEQDSPLSPSLSKQNSENQLTDYSQQAPRFKPD